MIEIRNASIEFGPGVSPENALRIARRALELLAAHAPRRSGTLTTLKPPAVKLAANDAEEAVGAEALAATIRGAIDASPAEDGHA